MASSNGRDFSILVVCTGNVCRSPAAEVLMRAELGSRGIAIRSAGTRALVGEPIQPSMEGLLRGTGVSGAGFAAQQLTEAMVASADLILTATREHRALVVEESPAALRRTFSLREFARLASRVDPERLDAAAGAEATVVARLASLVPLAAAHRSQADAGQDDVVDPFGRSEAVYLESFGQIRDGVGRILRVVLRHDRRMQWGPRLGSSDIGIA